MFEGKRVLITGAYGFIGSNLTRELVKLGAKVFVLSRKESDKWRLSDIKNFIRRDFPASSTRGTLLRSPPTGADKHALSSGDERSEAPRLKEYEVDLGDKRKLGETVWKIKPEIIYHLASFGGHYFQKDHEKIIETNLTGTINLLNALLPIGYDCFVNTGSSSEYGFKDKPMKEDDVLEPVSFYAATKASVSLLCQVYAKNFGKNIVTLRPFTVYGYADTGTKFVPTAIRACLTGKTLKLTAGDQRHDYIFIEDVLKAYLKAPFVKNISGEIFNIGSGRQYSNLEVVRLIEKIYKKKIRVEKGGYEGHSWDTTYWVAENAKAEKLLGWRPKISLDGGLKKTIGWFKRNLKYYV